MSSKKINSGRRSIIQKDGTNQVRDIEKSVIDKSKLTRLSSEDSKTTEAYFDLDYLYLFDKKDGHLAFQYNRRTRKVEYACDCMKHGLKQLGYLK